MITTFATPYKEICKANCIPCQTGFHNFCDGSMDCDCSKPGYTCAEIDEMIVEEMENAE